MDACPDENELDGYVAHRLPDAARERLTRHLTGCEPCQVLVAALAQEGRRGEDTGGAAPSFFSGPEAGLPPGTAVGRFTLLERVGAGGMGVVYAAYDPQLDRRVALKFLRTDRQGPRAAARLLQEAQAMARLVHRHVVSVFDVGEQDGVVYLAMEFVYGRTLRAWLAERPRAPRAIFDAFRQAGAGLGAAHAAGLVHRDFKPENVMVDWDGRVRVGDFGLSGAPDGGPPDDDTGEAARSPRPILGTPRYMAPEQLAGERTDARTDQFAFCVALWEALAGRPPFDDADPASRLAAIRGRTLPPLSARGVPHHVAAALARGLEADPARRFPSMAELCRSLTPSPPSRWRRLGTASLGVAVVAAGAWLAWPPPAEERCAAAGAAILAEWSPERAAGLRQRLDAAGGAGLPVTAALDGYALAWQRAAVDACRASEVRHEQSPERKARREGCLMARREALAVSLETLEAASDARLALRVVEGLRPPDSCERSPRPVDLGTARSLAAARASANLGEREGARARASAILVDGPGEAAPEAELLLADLADAPDASLQHVTSALAEAERRRLDHLVPGIAERLSSLARDDEERRLWTRYAEASAQRARRIDPW